MPQPNRPIDDRWMPLLAAFFGVAALVPSVALLGLVTLVPRVALAAPFTVAGVSFDTDQAITRASVSGGGYTTPLDKPNNVALASDTSPDWTIGQSLGTQFQRPTFQNGYSATTPVAGAAGTAATLGQDPGFPPTNQVREIILLQWTTGFGLTDATGDDLAIFEQATSEAFAVRVHVTSGTPAWSPWYYTPYEYGTDKPIYDEQYDSTPTRIDLTGDLGLATGVVINAIEITNLIAADTVATRIPGSGYGSGELTFGGATGEFAPGRWSSSKGAWAGFEAGKYDPDIQYVVALRALTSGVSDILSPLGRTSGVSQPERLPPAGGSPALPLPGAAPLLLFGLALLGGLRRRPAAPSFAT